MRRLKRTVGRATKGFTAIEISMVITVIAILALMILPLFRDRVEAARRAAAQDEIKSLLTAEVLAFADTGYYFRLQDLDNTREYNDPPIRPDDEVPITSWNRAFTLEERRKLRGGSNEWKGPYVSIGKIKYMEAVDALNAVPEFFWSYPQRGGPIMDLTPGAGWLGPSGWQDSAEDKVLIDPWGTPYLFFGPGQLLEEGGSYVSMETDFGHGVIYSLGSDGMPGDSIPYQGNPPLANPTNSPALLREAGVLGDGDDFFVFL